MWRHNDLTQAPNPNAALTDGPPSGYAYEEEERQYVVYLSSDGHIRQLNWLNDRDGPDWIHDDLMLETEVSPPLAGGDPRGYAFEWNESRHVVYLGVDGHIHELHWRRREGRNWEHTDLTAETGAPLPAGNPSGYAYEGGESRHVVYRSANGRIHELHWRRREGPNWRHNDLTDATDPDAPLAASDPFGYAFEGNESQHVVYLGVDGHIHELHWKNDRAGADWRHNDLTTATDPNAPLPAGEPRGYAYEEGESRHVVYRGTDDHIHELHWESEDTTWLEDVLGVVGTIVTGTVDVITTIVNVAVEIVESTLGWLVSLVAFFVELVFSIPLLGRLLKWIWNGIVTLVLGLAGLPDMLLSLIGIRPEKKLRVCVIILRDENGDAVDTPANVVPQLQNLVDIFRREANIRVIPVAPFQFDSGFGDRERVTVRWVHTADSRSDRDNLDVGCSGAALGQDLGLTGTEFEMRASTTCFFSNARRVFGYGAPVIVFIVRTVGGDEDGCSLGPLSDYVTVEANRAPDSTVLAHEVGHACNLPHFRRRRNLMNPNAGERLNDGQVAWLRGSSRHVTYF